MSEETTPALDPAGAAERAQTANEVMESMTGVEEQAVVDAFDTDVVVLAARRPATWSRAMALVLLRRQGVKPAAAQQRVMALTMREVEAMFADEDAGGDDDLPGAPESESGKDGE